MSSRILAFLVLAIPFGNCSEPEEPKRPPKQAAVLSAAFGDIFFRGGAGKSWHSARKGYALKSGDAVKSGMRSKAEIQTRRPATLLRIEENTTIVFEQSEDDEGRQVSARIFRGSVWGKVKRLESGEAFKIEGPASVTAFGTSTFRTEVPDDGPAAIFVFDGTVEVKRQFVDRKKPEVQMIGKGEGLLMPDGEPSRKVKVSPNDPLRRGWRKIE